MIIHLNVIIPKLHFLIKLPIIKNSWPLDILETHAEFYSLFFSQKSIFSATKGIWIKYEDSREQTQPDGENHTQHILSHSEQE